MIDRLRTAVLGVCLALALAACSKQAPQSYRAEVAQPLAVVEAALTEIATDQLTADFKLPAGSIGRGPDGAILWNVPTGDELAGQMQIVLTPIAGGRRTLVVATYAPAAVSAAASVVPGLRDPAILGDLLIKAVTARVTALDPSVTPAVARRNNQLAAEYLTAARIAANPTAISDATHNLFEQASAQMNTGPDPEDVVRDAQQASESVGQTAGAAAQDGPANYQDGPAKYGAPMVDPSAGTHPR